MRASVYRYDAERAGIFVEDRYVIRALQDLELIRHTPGLRRDQRHAVRSRSGIVRPAHHTELLGARLQNRPCSRSARCATRAASTAAGIDTRQIRIAAC